MTALRRLITWWHDVNYRARLALIKRAARGVNLPARGTHNVFGLTEELGIPVVDLPAPTRRRTLEDYQAMADDYAARVTMGLADADDVEFGPGYTPKDDQ